MLIFPLLPPYPHTLTYPPNTPQAAGIVITPLLRNETGSGCHGNTGHISSRARTWRINCRREILAPRAKKREAAGMKKGI